MVDANVWFIALTSQSSLGDQCREELSADPNWIQPEHARIEVLRTLGKLELSGSITSDDADVFCVEVCKAPVLTIGNDSDLLSDAWKLRHNVSLYDAPYIVLAYRYASPLITCDRRLAKAAATAKIDVRLLSAD